MPKKPDIGKTFHVGSFLVTVEDVIAEGGFALVFLTRDQMGRRYALKRSYVNSEADVAMCQQEIQILESLGRDNDSYIVRYLASTINVVDEEVKEVLILLEYYKYSVLQLMNERFQAKRNLAEEEILNIFADICHAVGKLHTHRPAWAHRDLKVENILIDKDGRCVLCDFGSCTTRILDPLKHAITDIEEDLKKYTTIAYRSPEMVNLYGYKKPVTTKADIWALGVLLYKMAYFTLPFGESSLAIQNCNLQFPSTPAYSKMLTGLIRYCLKVNPDERPEIFQVASLTCALAGRDCHVPNVNRSPVPSTDYLLNQPEQIQVVPASFNETSPPRVVRPPVLPGQPEFSSTTSIAPRERPKASTPASNIVLLPALKIPNGSSDHSREGQTKTITSRPGNVETSSAFRPVNQAVNPFRDAVNAATFSRPDVPVRPQKMGHRRNTSDTSMVPMTRPLSPTPTQNISEKSRSADTSPVRSPYPGGDVEKKFSNWNPFDDADVWGHAPPPPPPSATSSAASMALGLAQSVSSLVNQAVNPFRDGSISSASRTTLASPTGEEKAKSKPRSGTAEVKKDKKKKFIYQKFDNDSEEELMPSDGGDDLIGGIVEVVAGESKPATKIAKIRDKDTDSIGSASDLKHDDDTTDDERAESRQHARLQHHPDHDKTEEEDNVVYDSVQYGTLEESTSAIQNTVPGGHSILQETSDKPLLDNGFDKSDDDELERGRPPPPSVTAQRRLTFESLGLASVFDQIPFRYPKKSKTFTTFKGATDGPENQKLTDEGNFAGTNPFLTSYPKTNAVAPLLSESTHEFENIAGRYTEPTTATPKLPFPPPVPPKPTFLRKESTGSATKSGHLMEFNNVFPTTYADHPMDENLVDFGAEDVAAPVLVTKTSRKVRSPVRQESLPLFSVDYQSQSGSPKISKSPTRRSRRMQEGISNISFEDA